MRRLHLAHLETIASVPEDYEQDLRPEDVMERAGLSSDTYLKIQQKYKRLARDQRTKMKTVMTICVFGTPHAFDPNEVIFELEMKNDTPCYEVNGE